MKWDAAHFRAYLDTWLADADADDLSLLFDILGYQNPREPDRPPVVSMNDLEALALGRTLGRETPAAGA